MKLKSTKSIILMAILAVFLLATGNAFATPIDVSYTVGGQEGDYLLTFTVDQSFAVDQSICIFGVDVGTSAGYPAGWTSMPNASYPSRWFNNNSEPGDLIDAFLVRVNTLPIEDKENNIGVNYVVWVKDAQNISQCFKGVAFDPPVAPVPEPATMFLLGSGLVGMAGLRRKFKK